jgi:type I restriction enzyme R subunit
MNWELDEVERPFVEQLVAVGWHYVEGNLDHPECTGRTSFAEVMRAARLRRRIHALNLRDVAGTQVILHK